MFDESMFISMTFKNLFHYSIVASETLKKVIKSNNYARATMCRKRTLQLSIETYKREMRSFNFLFDRAGNYRLNPLKS